MLYYGQVDGETRTVHRVRDDGSTYQLDPRLDLANHSPTGLEWGYSGSGPAQTALAILADYCGDTVGKESRLYQPFKEAFLNWLPKGTGWTLTESDLLAWLGPRLARFVADGPPPVPELPMIHSNMGALLHDTPSLDPDAFRERGDEVISLAEELAADRAFHADVNRILVRFVLTANSQDQAIEDSA